MPTEDELLAQVANLTAERDAAQARIKELNGEAKGHRLNADNFRTQAEKAAADAEAARNEAEAKIAEAHAKATETLTKAQQKAVNADLRLAAKDAGAVDIGDVLALVDRSKLKLSADGDVENAAELIAEMKTAKPHLFGVATTGSTTRPPPKKETAPTKATEMTPEEYTKARAAKAWRT